MSRIEINFSRAPESDSKGRNGFIISKGVEICELGASLSSDRDAAIWFSPITSRGNVSEACRVAIARSALPEVINALAQFLPEGAAGDQVRRIIVAYCDRDQRERSSDHGDTWPCDNCRAATELTP